MMQVNIWAVLVAAVSSMVVGSIWYGPLFGKLYVSLMGWDGMSEEQKKAKMKGMTLTYLWQFLASVVMFYVLAMFMSKLNVVDVMGGLQVAFWAWLGFVVTMKLGDALWGGKMKMFWLGAGGSLITFLVGGLILSLWR